MNDNKKTTYRFSATDGIVNIIENWAKNSVFAETAVPKQLDNNDLTYCFSLDENGRKTLITINILDNIVYIETWVVLRVSRSGKAIDQISNLIKQIDKESIRRMK